MQKKISYKSFFLVSLAVIFADQLTKWIIEIYKPNIKLTNFFSITYITNKGAAFGILPNQRALLILASVVFLGIVLFYLKKLHKETIFPVALLFGGAVGNLIDRIFLGFVVDFINFSFWPAFNVADSCISIGAALLLFFVYFRR